MWYVRPQGWGHYHNKHTWHRSDEDIAQDALKFSDDDSISIELIVAHETFIA